jgi:uncharacterized ferredoxin-like protein
MPCTQPFGDDLLHRHARAEAAIGVLEHDLHVARAAAAQLARRPALDVRPMNTIGPSEEISRMIASASVVLPDPLSPTMPSVSPART